MEIRISPRFERNYKKLPNDIKGKAKTREQIFQSNPFDVRLETHKLHGKDDGRWAYSIDYEYRIKFMFFGKGAVLYLDVGTHDEVYR
ncbi:MAG: type II toxin-antitoxin system mRNA interferase toxin, RelE/StbE family [Patescibacteria group bacterium]